MAIGILSFGSLLHEPGPELEARITGRVDGVETPFPVEFARSSRTRDGAPTLVPVDSGGAPVPAGVLVLADDVDVTLARELLYRRESRRGSGDVGERPATAKWLKQAGPLAGLEECLYVGLPANVDPLTAAHLAELALSSAAAPAGARRHDGISYLREQKDRGVRTPLMPSYEAEILARTASRDLKDAWTKVRGT